MRKIRDKNLAELLVQLRFTPVKSRQKQLESAEKLFEIIEKGKEYPFDFVCFRITGFHPKTLPAEELIKGDELVEDLQVFISKLSGRLARPVREQKEKVYTTEELADLCEVSTKTIGRWRKRGLIARKFIFDDGKKRIGFLQSVVDRFLKENPELTAKAKGFGRLTEKEKQEIIRQAKALSVKRELSRYQIIEQVAAKSGKAHETVRYTLLNYEKANPDKPISYEPPGVIGPATAAEMYEMFKKGLKIEELMERFGRSKSSIYRIINRRRVKALLARKVEFIASDEFVQDDARGRILAGSFFRVRGGGRKGKGDELGGGGSGGDYLQKSRDMKPLNRERELELFRRYNYLKHLACLSRAEINHVRPSGRRLKQVEGYLAEAEVIKNRIIESNLPLVVSIASKHVSRGANLLDLVSEGNFSLMRAVEKFDYTRGFRFRTYASWAIAKDYARKIPAEAARPDKAPTASLVNIQRDLRATTAAGVVAIERARQSLVQVIRENLSEREQYIIISHFGLIGSLIKKEKKTLKQIGDDLGLSKERVRQLELIALQKLRHFLSIEEFELLTG